MTGGVAALCGAAVVGPRTGRFDEKKKPLPMPGHSTTLQVMGTMILWLGWYGFNPGSTLGLSATNYARDAARVVVTTTISAATGGVTVCMLEKMLGDKTWSVGAVCNGILAGLVSITSGCSVVYPWAAMIMGFLGGFVYFGASKCVLNVLKVDDPLDAFAVHGLRLLERLRHRPLLGHALRLRRRCRRLLRRRGCTRRSLRLPLRHDRVGWHHVADHVRPAQVARPASRLCRGRGRRHGRLQARRQRV